jgi:hypothetical protein
LWLHTVGHARECGKDAFTASALPEDIDLSVSMNEAKTASIAVCEPFPEIMQAEPAENLHDALLIFLRVWMRTSASALESPGRL